MQNKKLVCGYLLSTLMLISACADIQESEPNFAVHAHVTLGHGASASVPGVQILFIYKKDAADKKFTPSPGALSLWLHSGDYVAKIERCNEPSENEQAKQLIKNGIQLGADHLFSFSVKTNGLYHLLCATSADGTIYMWNGEVIEVMAD